LPLILTQGTPAECARTEAVGSVGDR